MKNEKIQCFSSVNLNGVIYRDIFDELSAEEKLEMGIQPIQENIREMLLNEDTGLVACISDKIASLSNYTRVGNINEKETIEYVKKEIDSISKDIDERKARIEEFIKIFPEVKDSVNFEILTNEEVAVQKDIRQKIINEIDEIEKLEKMKINLCC